MRKLFSVTTAITAAVLVLLLIALSMFFTDDEHEDYMPAVEQETISLYGEAHGVQSFYDKELEAWLGYYNQGYRDLFVELPYYEGKLLNDYIKADDETLLQTIYSALEGTASHTEMFLNFYRAIKEKAPETVFHATDLGHQHESLGAFYLRYLTDKGMEDSEEYQRTQEVIEQGDTWYNKVDCDGAYREGKMVENFVWDYNKLVEEKKAAGFEGSVKIMGIYGGYHCQIRKSDIMSGMLKEYFGDIISCRYITNLVLEKKTYEIGFSYAGLIFIVLLMVPNIIFGITINEELRALMANENKVFLIIERIGETLAVIALLLFPVNNPSFVYQKNVCFFAADRLAFFVIACLLMAIYEFYWVQFFRSPRKVSDFYHPTMGVPFAGASLPCLAFFCLGIYTGNIFTLVAAVILTIGHMGIHISNYKKAQMA